MRAAVPVAVVLLIAALVALVVVTREDDDAYRVRAIFDNAGFVIPGEDVKVAGVKVGSISDVEVTPDFKAAVVLQIDDPAYQDFRADASCIVRPQSLIGERFVECDPTRTRGVGAEPAGPLRQIEEGPGEGEYLLPVENTSKTVDLDLLNDIMREPERQRLSIILNELGVGLAGRGADLNAVIRRANPALKEVDEVLKLLARQNDELARLAVDSDTIMAPLARERAHVGSSIANMAAVAGATAERRVALEEDIQKLPAFLAELKPTMEQLGALADEMTPVFTDLGAVAPDINRFLLELGPFSQAAIPAFDTLGDAAVVGTPAIRTATPVLQDTQKFAAKTKPVAKLLKNVLTSFKANDGLEQLLNFVFYSATAVNGFDSFGHYLRAALIVNQCSTYAVAPTTGCSANFRRATSSSASAAGTGQPRDQVLDWTSRVLQGLDAGDPPAAEPQQAARPAAKRVKQGTAAAAAPADSGLGASEPASEPLLDYLFGGDER